MTVAAGKEVVGVGHVCAEPSLVPMLEPRLTAILDAKCSAELGFVRVSDQCSQRVSEPGAECRAVFSASHEPSATPS